MKGRSHGLGGLPGSGGARDSATATAEGHCQFVAPWCSFPKVTQISPDPKFMSMTAALTSMASPIATWMLKHFDGSSWLKNRLDRAAFEKAVHSYICNYQNAYGLIKPIGMTEPIELSRIYTEVQMCTSNLRESYYEENLEVTASRRHNFGFDGARLKTED
jgi:hypothetical protein